MLQSSFWILPQNTEHCWKHRFFFFWLKCFKAHSRRAPKRSSWCITAFDYLRETCVNPSASMWCQHVQFVQKKKCELLFWNLPPRPATRCSEVVSKIGALLNPIEGSRTNNLSVARVYFLPAISAPWCDDTGRSERSIEKKPILKGSDLHSNYW